VSDGTEGTRLPVDALVGLTVWASFHVDLVGAELTMTGEPDDVPPLARVGMPALEQHVYRAYPLVDHVADKVVAMFDRYGSEAAPSTRYKDLVDLVAIVRGGSVDAKAQAAALACEATRRKVRLPGRFDVPDLAMWERGYAAEARRSLLDVARTLEEALFITRPFLDPLLSGGATGRWDPVGGRWA
jgi:Nucleotidyl transferase AbiEii toxin, Type IV TA system